MTTPRTIAAAKKAGYKVIKVSDYNGYSNKERVDMEPRFYNSGMKARLSFWVSRQYAKKVSPFAY